MLKIHLNYDDRSYEKRVSEFIPVNFDHDFNYI